jgi:Ca2+-binding EF-hand superfamily protein
VSKKVDLIFQKYDTDGKGAFTRSQFRSVLKSSLIRDNKSISEPVLDKLTEMIDTNNNGLIERK